MVNDPDDVVARARHGDRAAFGMLVRKYRRRVFATALHITGNLHDADDVAQEAFIRAYRSLASFEGRSEVFTWLYRITVNTALNHLRSKKRRVAQASADAVGHDASPDQPATEHNPGEQLEIDERCRQVLAAVCQLSASLRITLVLAVVEGQSYRQIAEILDIPEGTVAWRVNEARKQLTARLAADDSESS